MIQAVGDRCPTLVRIPCSDDVWIKKAPDAGCDGIVVPQVNRLNRRGVWYRHASTRLREPGV